MSESETVTSGRPARGLVSPAVLWLLGFARAALWLLGLWTGIYGFLLIFLSTAGPLAVLALPPFLALGFLSTARLRGSAAAAFRASAILIPGLVAFAWSAVSSETGEWILSQLILFGGPAILSLLASGLCLAVGIKLSGEAKQ